jgi:hypothetical protein
VRSLVFARRRQLRRVVRIDHEFLGRSLPEDLVRLDCAIERDHFGVQERRQVRHPVLQDGHHQVAVVVHDRTLTGCE